MKFPKVASIQINQLPTDSSAMTPQEKYIFDTIFLPEVNEFERSSQMYQQQQLLQNQNQLQKAENTQDQDKDATKKASHPFGKKLFISVLLTAIIIVFAISPLPSLIKGSMVSPVILSAIILGIFALSFLVFQSYINI
jgi:cation transport ATPase